MLKPADPANVVSLYIRHCRKKIGLYIINLYINQYLSLFPPALHPCVPLNYFLYGGTTKRYNEQN